MDSSDSNRIATVRSYFRHSIKRKTDLQGREPDFGAILDLYKAHEAPGRSNYFNDLLLALSLKQQSVGLTKAALIDYIGPPDGMTNSGESELLHYKYTRFGRDSVGFVQVSNGTVVGIRFKVGSASRTQSR